jgi:hypothetical protein
MVPSLCIFHVQYEIHVLPSLDLNKGKHHCSRVVRMCPPFVSTRIRHWVSMGFPSPAAPPASRIQRWPRLRQRWPRLHFPNVGPRDEPPPPPTSTIRQYIAGTARAGEPSYLSPKCAAPVHSPTSSFEGSLYGCSGLYCSGRGMSPNGDRYINIGPLRGRNFFVYVMKRSFFYRSRLKRSLGPCNSQAWGSRIQREVSATAALTWSAERAAQSHLPRRVCVCSGSPGFQLGRGSTADIGVSSRSKVRGHNVPSPAWSSFESSTRTNLSTRPYPLQCSPVWYVRGWFYTFFGPASRRNDPEIKTQ